MLPIARLGWKWQKVQKRRTIFATHGIDETRQEEVPCGTRMAMYLRISSSEKDGRSAEKDQNFYWNFILQV